MDSTTLIRGEGFDRLVPIPPFNSFVGLARHIAVIGIGGLLTGLVVGGVGGRIFMRIAGAAASDRVQGFGTEAGFSIGEVTFVGSFFLVLFIGTFTGVAGAILYAAYSPWIAWAGRFRGLAFGVILFGATSATSDVMNPDNIDFFILGNSVLLVSLIAVLFMAFGLVMVSLVAFLERRLPADEDRSTANTVEYLAITAIGLLAIVATIPLFFTDGACDCEPPFVASWSVVLAGLGTLLLWLPALIERAPKWLRLFAAILGYAGLAGVVVFGLLRAARDAIEIIG